MVFKLLRPKHLAHRLNRNPILNVNVVKVAWCACTRLVRASAGGPSRKECRHRPNPDGTPLDVRLIKRVRAQDDRCVEKKLLHLVLLNELAEGLFVRLTDRDHRRADLHITFMNHIDRTQCYNKRIVNAYKPVCR